MVDRLVIDDMFVAQALWRFHATYDSVYGNRIAKPLDYRQVVKACAAMAHWDQAEAHVFYVEERMSPVLQATATAEALRLFKTHGVTEQELRGSPVEMAGEMLAMPLPSLLDGIPGIAFHPCQWLASSVVTFINENPVDGETVLVADDPMYTGLPNPEKTILLRLDSEISSMPVDIRWQDIGYALCLAYGVHS